MPSLSPYWAEVFDLKMNHLSEPDPLNDIILLGDDPYIYGNFMTTGGLCRPFVAKLPSNNDSLVFQEKIYNARFLINDLTFDQYNNSQVIFANSTYLIKNDSLGALVLGKEYAGVDIFSRTVRDGAGNLYVISLPSTGHAHVTKVLESDFSVIWSIEINTNSAFIGSGIDCVCDTAGDLYLRYASSANSLHYVMKVSSAGSVLWQYVTTDSFRVDDRAMVIDSSNNLYLLYTQGTDTPIKNILVKLDSNGNKLAEYISSDSLVVYSNLAINGSTLYVATAGDAGADIGIDVHSLTTTFNTINTCTFDPGYNFTQLGIAVSSNYFYLYGSILNTGPIKFRVTGMTIKIPNDLNFSASAPYNFTITADNGTSYVFSNTLTIDGGAGLPIWTASTYVNFSATSFTTSSLSVTSSDTVPSYTPVTPFDYVTYL